MRLGRGLGELGAQRAAGRLVEADGRVVTHQTSMPGITYSSSRVSGDAIPTSMADLLKPQYKGRIASTPYAAGFDWLASPDGWGKERVVEYLRAFKGQVAGLIRCNEMERLANGEFDLFAMQCSQNAPSEQAKTEGAASNFLVPTDAAVLAPLYVAVPLDSAHPSAAKLWINYLLSREAQDLSVRDGPVRLSLAARLEDRPRDRPAASGWGALLPGRHRFLPAERRGRHGTDLERARAPADRAVIVRAGVLPWGRGSLARRRACQNCGSMSAGSGGQ